MAAPKLPEHVPTPVEPGYTTTEFWTTLLTNAGAAFTLIFHKTFPVPVQTTATSAAGLATLVYTFSRAKVKSS